MRFNRDRGRGGFGGRGRGGFGGRGRGGFGGGRGYDIPKPVKVGEEYDVEITEVGSKGDGICRIKNFIVFVNGAKKGEKIKIKITDVMSRFAVAEKVGEATGAVESGEAGASEEAAKGETMEEQKEMPEEAAAEEATEEVAEEAEEEQVEEAEEAAEEAAEEPAEEAEAEVAEEETTEATEE